MHTTQNFNALTVPIQGVNLIEASAGTGKTYSIAALFLRLVLSEHIGVDRILVVTFTKAATAELKNRLRSRLESAFQVLRLSLAYQTEHGCDSDKLPKDLANLIKNDGFFQDYSDFDDVDYLYLANEKEALPRLCLRLQAALNQFDHATIYTIHSYCQRLLQDYAFLCQSPFRTELSENTSTQMQVLAADFWREHVIHDAILSECVYEANLTPDAVLNKIRSFINRPYIQVNPSKPSNVAQAKQHLEQTWQTISAQLPDLYALFCQYPAKNFHGSWMNQAQYCEEVFEPLLAHGLNAMNADLCKRLGNFSEDLFRKRISKSGPATFEDLVSLTILAQLPEALENVMAEKSALIENLHMDLLQFINQKWAEQKQKVSERGFDDLLVDVYNALQHETYGTQLSDSIAKKWQVALIDEFQDTDPLQYQIFQQSFIDNNIPIFLVGDPKQAIYRFRGADIHAYLQAATDAKAQYTLATNFRSHKALVKSIAHLFLPKIRPFIMEQIPYIDVDASRDSSLLSDNAGAILLNWLNKEDEDKLNKDVARARSAQAAANQIAQLLTDGQQGSLKLKDANLEAKDIAVLVRTHNEGKEIREALYQKNIASVMISQESVFASEEASTAIALLKWWLQPGNTGLLRYILLSPLFAYSADDIMALNHDEIALLRWIDSAQAAQDIWHQNSVFAAYQFFSVQHALEAQLLARQDDRILTNIHQVFELLAAESLEHDHIESLLAWLEKQVHAAKNGLNHDSSQLRLESDDSLVKIVTMHASKGLQYPIVFCPFIWDTRKFELSEFNLTHDENNCAILKSKNAVNDNEEQTLHHDQLSEDLRLLYVALTRAEERLYLNLCHYGDSSKTALSYLISQPANSSPEQVLENWKKCNASAQKAMWDAWMNSKAEEHSIHWVDDIADMETVTTPSHAETYEAKTWQERAFKWVQNTSFTALSRHRQANNSAPNSDDIAPNLDSAEIASNDGNPIDNELSWDIFHFPKGAHAGLCLHELLEQLDFEQDATLQENKILPILERYGFEESWLPSVTDMLNTTAKVSLGAFSLSQLTSNQRLPEMGFVIKTEQLSLTHVIEFIQQSDLPAAIKTAVYGLDFRAVNGFLNGFIDMTCTHKDGVVTLIDYKSNHLGMSTNDYQSDALNQAMAEHHYYLQCLLYAVAIKRYFASRHLKLHSIEVRYLFLRGLALGSDTGIWSWDIDCLALDNFVI